ncbi:YpmS family protein [Ligilactobacillus faecis]|uniref:YpmS family protein n=1 Tax=Ligilactobacillus faecis TaxID=762833 RepID=UPI0024682751|nr:YpmS family protein [Ligilactobacillus faecis]WGN89180.1 YpmS family protein [Ligilactobacillus faecis]
MDKKVNGWKWAFIVLLGAILGLTLFLWLKVTTPNQDQQALTNKEQKTTSKKYADLNVAMNKEQLSAAVNYYLQQNQKQGSIKYRFILDNSAILMGTTKILGKNVSFTLYTQPKLDKEGNIQLKARSVAIGSLNAPPNFVLGYIKNNYDLGAWATIDAKKETITLDLDQLTKKQGIKIKGRSLDLSKNDLNFDVSFPLENTN